MDLVMEVFFYFRLGQLSTKQRSVLYYSCATNVSSVENIDELPEQDDDCKRLVLVSDTHDRFNDLCLPKGDVFIHAGDILMTSRALSASRGTEKLQNFNNWLGTLDFKDKLVIAGNHDEIIELLGTEKTAQILSNATYLLNEIVEIDSVRYFGCPLSAGHSKNKSFQSNEFLTETQDLINSSAVKGVDVFISHGPNFRMAKVLQPQLQVWGHVHKHYGVHKPGGKVGGHSYCGLSVCPSIMTARYNPSNLPIVVDFSTKKTEENTPLDWPTSTRPE